MADGTAKCIEQVRVNEQVRTGSQPGAVAHVAEVITREVERVIAIELAPAYKLVTTGSDQTGSLVATPEHEVWVDGKGWTLAGKLQAGDWLLDSTGKRHVITRLTESKRTTRVYTLSNREDHAFYANNLLVRDSCGERRPATPAAKPAKAPEVAEVTQ